MVKISLIIATYNRGEQLLRTLRSVATQDMPFDEWEAIVVNNNSSDDTEEIFARFQRMMPHGINIRMVFEGRQGLSHARNCGIAESVGEIIAVIDDDEEINPEFLRQYLDFFSEHPAAAAAGGKIQPCYEYETPNWLSPILEIPLAAKIDLGPRAKVFGKGRYPIGGNMAYRRTVLDKVGVFDPNLGRTGKSLMGGEEKDLMERIRRSGGRIYWVPGPTVQHIIPQSRMTPEYLFKLSYMIGRSEKVRSRAISSWSYLQSVLLEGFKWGATLILGAGYTLKGQPAKAKYLILMRSYITRGLMNTDRDIK